VIYKTEPLFFTSLI